MTSIAYRDLELEIVASHDTEYALAVRSPAGETRQALVLPFAPEDLAAWQQRLESSTISSAIQSRGLRLLTRSSAEEPPSTQQFGAALFGAVFTGNALSLFDTSRALAKQDNVGLRIRLRILAPALATLPWELFFDPRQGEFLCLSQQTPLVRTVESMQPLETLAVTPPLRILGMAAASSDLAPLDLAREQELLKRAIASVGQQVELGWTVGGSWRALLESLQQGPWHVFHFMGHGLFDEAAAEGMLALTDEQGRADLRTTQEIARLLTDHPTLRLVVLNACEGAQSATQALYASIAERLVRRGLPAVLAMQYAITDGAATEFARSFYGALANYLPVDAASAEARKAMSLAAPDSWEWATPVLFLRSADGELWSRATKAEGDKMESKEAHPWWDQVTDAIGKMEASNVKGDVIIATVGAGAKNVAVGKNITQTVTEVLGPPAPDDKKQIAQGFAMVLAALAKLPVDDATAERAKARIEILQEELEKPGDDAPSASTIIKLGDWLLDNLPAIGAALGTFFALPAVGRVVGAAGEPAVQWVRQRFGK